MTDDTPFLEEAPSPLQSLVQAVTMTALSLALAAGIGVALLRDAGQPPRRAAAGAPARSEQPLSPAAAVPDRREWTVPPFAQPPEEHVLYIVPTAEQAEWLRSQIEQLSAVRDALGLAPLTAEVLAFGSVEEETQFWLARAEQEVVHSNLALLDTRVVDLRERGPGAR